jgi:hypothetical protein
VIPIVKEVIEAHGGMGYWRGLEALEAESSARGFLFTAKRRPVLDHLRVRAYTREPRFAFLDFPEPSQSAELIGNDEVLIKDADGRTIARRLQPRAAFRGVRRLFHWDDLDFTYFAGYATWNYLTTPFIFMREGFVFGGPGAVEAGPAPLFRLPVTFPDDIPSHCKRQIFYFDQERLLRRLDYTAEVVGRWAHAAHLCGRYRTFGGIRAPTRRRVLPLFFGRKPLPGPTLISLEVHDIQPVAASR